MAIARVEYSIDLDEYFLTANGRRIVLQGLRPEVSAMLSKEPLTEAAKAAGVQQIDEDTENVRSDEENRQDSLP